MKKLAGYLTAEEFLRLIKLVRKKHHKLAFMLAFNSGLRVSEVVNLQREDIDTKRKRIHIKNAKGRKDRVVPLPKGFPLAYLKLIPLKCGIRALQMAFKGYLEEAGINRPGLRFHSLRHSFAVRCLDRGIPLNVVQSFLGHESIKTTSIYTKINPKHALESYEKLW